MSFSEYLSNVCAAGILEALIEVLPLLAVIMAFQVAVAFFIGRLSAHSSSRARVRVMAAAYEAERARYLGGVVYYPNNGAAYEAAMKLAIEAGENGDKKESL